MYSKPIRAVAGAFAVLAAVGSPAYSQTSDWILARSLHVTLPGDPRPGGVPWSKNNLGLPTSWSTEASGMKVEIAEQYGGRADQEAQRILPGARVQQVSISGYPAWEGAAGNDAILSIQAAKRVWTLVVRNGGQNAGAIFRTVTLERDDPQNWQRRNWGAFPLVTQLPYDLAPDRRYPQSDQRSDYELKFDGFSITESLQRANEGAKLDFKKTLDEDVAKMKKHDVYKDVKVDRDRIKDLPSGEMIQYWFTEKGRKKRQFYLVGERNGLGLQVRWTFDAENPVHEDYSNRILLSFKEDRTNLSGLKTWKAGEHGLWLDTPGALEQTKSSSGMAEWEQLFGLLLITTRVVENSAHNMDPNGALDMMDIKFGGQQNIKDYKAQRSPIVVSGIEGSVLKAKFKSNNSDTYRWALVVQTYEKTYVVEIMGVEEARMQRILDSVRIDLGKEGKLPRVAFKNAPFSVQVVGDAKVTDMAAQPGIASAQMVQIIEPGQLGFTAVSQKTGKGEVLNPVDFVKKSIDELAKTTKGKTTLLASGIGNVESANGAWAKYDLELNGKKMACWCYALVKGDTIVLVNMLMISTDPAVLGVAQALMNSVRVGS